MRRIFMVCMVVFACATTVAWGATMRTAATHKATLSAGQKTKSHSRPKRHVAVKARTTSKPKRNGGRAGKKPVAKAASASSNLQAPLASGTSLLLGEKSVMSTLDENAAGTAEAFPFTAALTGTARSISVFLDTRNTAKTLVAAVYRDSSGQPSSLLASGSLSSLKAGAWNTVTIPNLSITSGRQYWLALLSKGGPDYFRDTSTANQCRSVTSKQTTLTAAPATWATATHWQSCQPSAFVAGVATPQGTLTPTPPTGPSGSGAPVTILPPLATAAPQVTGTPTEGQTLSSTTGTWTGSPTAYAYQWQDCDALGLICQNIAGATSSTYTLTDSDVSAYVRAVVTATNSLAAVPANSNLDGPIAQQPAPTNTTAPTISGTTTQGQTLTAARGSWSGSPTAYAYQWRDCDTSGSNCTSISGATGSSYTLTANDVGNTIRVAVTATNTGGSAAATSAATATIASSTPAAPTNTTAPTISGTTTQGQTLTAARGSWSGSPTAYAYQWRDCDTSGSNCTSISGATGSSYTLTANDVGNTIRVAVTATNTGGSAAATSAATATIASSTPAAPTNTTAPTISGTTTQGQTLTAARGSWSGSPTAYAYQWRDCDTSGSNCTSISGATGSSYTLTANDVGNTIRVAVTATNTGGSAAATSTATATVAGSGGTGTGGTGGTGGTVVGATGEPNVTCSTTLNPGANVQNALASASNGQVVCLNGGNWAAQTITGVTHTGMVTLAATPGASVTIAGLTITGQTNNLTIEGMTWTRQFFDRSGISNVIFQYNTLQNLPDTFAVYSYPRSVGGNGVANGVQVLYNQFDHIGSCVELDGGEGMQENWTISHNVCGPDVGDGISSADDPSHYIQIGGVSGVTIDNNAFEGPYDAQGIKDGPHNNVIHVWGTQSDIDIENNIMWHTDSRAQTILIEEGHTDGVIIKNNLDIEDPANFTNSNIYTMAWDVNKANSETIVNNTAVSPFWGTMDGVLYQQSSGDYTNTTNQTVTGNIVEPKAPGGDSNFNTSCSSSCSYGGNVSGDGSAPGSGSVLNWNATWQTTSWTPNSGSPWVAPPAGYYKPVGLSITAGYQGTIGP